jgi:hypothetical protein
LERTSVHTLSATDSHLIVTDGLSSFGRWRLPVVGSTLLREMRDTDVGRASQAQQLEEERFQTIAEAQIIDLGTSVKGELNDGAFSPA